MARGRKLESLNDYQRALKNKFGVGEGIAYKPWLRVKDVKSHGTRSEIPGRKVERVHHLMSSIESEFFFLAEFNDSVLDIREQFPILPLNYTQKVCKAIGVEHPKHPKTKEPIVLTTDFLLTVTDGNRLHYHAISVKPESKLDDKRVSEKLDVERVCWELLGVKFQYFTGNEDTKIQSRNIDWATSPFRQSSLRFSSEQIASALELIVVGVSTVDDLCTALISQNIVNHSDALSLIRLLIADKYITADLSLNIPETGYIDVIGKEVVPISRAKVS